MRPVGIAAAFLAGLASFLSPCVLPLVPGYISFISGFSLEELSSGTSKRDATRHAALATVFFVMGFASVFTALGASASFVGQLLAAHMKILSKVAGGLIIVLGLHTMGLIPIQWLYYTRRADTSSVAPGLAGAFVMGLAFAFGWTPCIGPILAAILALAATQENVAQGVGLLFIYSLGLGVPFILTGLGLNAFLRFFARYKRFIRWGELTAGALLVAIGVLVLANRLAWLAALLPSSFYKFAL
ncbi:MAG TPA: cytochrome C biogenesis protein [Elusimicrobia bacterium]|nr:cytochrome C biogenesis protein [Elusimicrobiota bacterium]HBT62171.1 cytochrome C biogenesis protein [Elusimicrobiota bacterium]